jgi:hypothetical protein
VRVALVDDGEVEEVAAEREVEVFRRVRVESLGLEGREGVDCDGDGRDWETKHVSNNELSRLQTTSFLPGAQGSEEILDGVAKDDSGASVAMDLVKLGLTLLVRVPVESVRPFRASLRVLIPFPAIFENVREPFRTSVAR